MVNGKVNKLKSKTQVIIGMGSSPTKGQAGPFMKKLVEKLKSLGYNNVYSVKEYFTSQKCPICKSKTQYVLVAQELGLSTVKLGIHTMIILENISLLG